MFKNTLDLIKREFQELELTKGGFIMILSMV